MFVLLKVVAGMAAMLPLSPGPFPFPGASKECNVAMLAFYSAERRKRTAD